jgi:PAS domain-containing protein
LGRVRGGRDRALAGGQQDHPARLTDREGGARVCAEVDVLERKRVEDALRESEERFRDFAETASDWFWEQDAELRFTYASGGHQMVSGLGPVSLRGHTRDELFGPDMSPADRAKHAFLTNHLDSALALFRQANIVYRDKPSAYLTGGIIFANSGQIDSAIVYWEKAAEIAERTNAVEDRNVATRNLGAMYQRANRHQEAIQALEKYLAWAPQDTEVKRALATSYRATGENDKAAALEKEA